MSYKSSFFLYFVYPPGKPRPKLCLGEIPRSPAPVCHRRMAKGSHVDGCCFAAAYGIRPWMPWIWHILNFRSIRVEHISKIV